MLLSCLTAFELVSLSVELNASTSAQRRVNFHRLRTFSHGSLSLGAFGHVNTPEAQESGFETRIKGSKTDCNQGKSEAAANVKFFFVFSFHVLIAIHALACVVHTHAAWRVRTLKVFACMQHTLI